MHNAVRIAKEIRNKNGWISDNDVKKLLNSNDEISDEILAEQNQLRRAYKIYKPLNDGTSKTVAAQWLVNLMKDGNQGDIKSLIEKDKEEDTGIKYLIDAIEHVTNGNIGAN